MHLLPRPLAAALALCLAGAAWPAAVSAQTDAGAGAGPSIPSLPDIEADPMLTPVPPPAHIVETWEQAIGILRARSTDLRIALDEVVRAEAGWRTALAGALPTVTASANVTVNLLRGRIGDLVVPDLLPYSTGLSVVQPALAPRAWHAVRTAEVVTANAKLSADEQRRQLALALANATVAVVTSERVSELNRIGLRAALERLALARRRAALGAANALDVVRAEQDVATARSTVVSGDESLRQARETLGLALGSTEPWGVPPRINLDGLQASARASCESLSRVDERTDLAAARGATTVARRNVDDVWLQFSPTINVVSNFNATSYLQGNQLHESWSIAGVLTVPLFEGGARYGALRDARAQVDEAAQRLEAARRTATVQVTQARRAVEVAEQSRQVAEEARNLARETERLARVAFQAGTGTSLDLIESGRILRVAEVQLAIQEFQVVQARLAAVLALARCRW